MRRREKQITRTADIEEILQQGQVCRLGFADRNVPYIVPMNYGYQDSALYFHSAPEGRKIDLIRANPLVCFEVDELVKMNKAANACDWGASFKSVIGTGTARILDTPEEKKAGLDIIMAQYSDRSFNYPDGKLAKTAVIKVTIEEMTGKQG
ncbi:MAG TPA: pyridoxamine 5'-phosphate oxidase family protein [Desulfotignum sp.]|nr:pyridoxamine 5'-phosphate oxidase family protein [Desulfotignum sp.]